MQKIKTIIFNTLFVAVCLVLLFGGFYVIQYDQDANEKAYRKQLIQELCEKQDYDFCEIEKIIYKERVEEDVDTDNN